MRPKRTALVIEDNANTALLVKRRLEASDRYELEVDVVTDGDTYARDHYHREYDVYVVDLNLDGGSGGDRPLFLGHLLPRLRHFERPGTLIVVYSAHDQLDQIVPAVRNGASAFVSKNEAEPEDALVGTVERLLDDRRRADEDQARADGLVARDGSEWREKYAGKVIVVVGDEVLEADESRLRALLAYRRRCLENPALPLNPVVVEVPAVRP